MSNITNQAASVSYSAGFTFNRYIGYRAAIFVVVDGRATVSRSGRDAFETKREAIEFAKRAIARIPDTSKAKMQFDHSRLVSLALDLIAPLSFLAKIAR